MIAKLVAFLKGKSGAFVAGLLAIAGAAAAVFARGRKQGALEQKVAQEEREDRAEADLRAGELAMRAEQRAREAKLVDDLVRIEEVAVEDKAHPPARLSGARSEQAASQKRLAQLRTEKRKP